MTKLHESDSRKIAIYSRKSKFTGKGESIANQIEICRAKIVSQYPDIKAEDILVFEDEGYSGKNLNRPQFSAMIEQVKSKKIKAVVSYRIDRMSRSVADFANMYEMFGDYDVDYISATENIETKTPLGRAMLSMCTVFAQMERETIAERIRDNMYELAKTGRWLGGRTPTGYESAAYVGSVSSNGKARKAFQLKIIPKEAEFIREVFGKFLETRSLSKTETHFLQNNIKTKNGKTITRFTIKNILQNPVYMAADEKSYEYFKSFNAEIFNEQQEFDGKHGIMSYNKTEQKDGRANKMRDIEDWIIAIGKHEPIISSADWIQTQTYLEQNKSKSYRKPKTNVALLSGVLYCKNCGSYMRPKLSARVNKDGEKIYDYLCELKEKSKGYNCNMKRPNGNELDKIVCAEIKKLSADDSRFIKDLTASKMLFDDKSSEMHKKIEELEKALSQNEKELDALVLSLTKADGTVAYDYIINKINELDGQAKILKQQIADYENLAKLNVMSDEEFDTLKELLSSFAKTFDLMSVQEKRDAIKIIVKRVEWDGSNVHIYLFGSDQHDAGPNGSASLSESLKCNNFEPFS